MKFYLKIGFLFAVLVFFAMPNVLYACHGSGTKTNKMEYKQEKSSSSKMQNKECCNKSTHPAPIKKSCMGDCDCAHCKCFNLQLFFVDSNNFMVNPIFHFPFSNSIISNDRFKSFDFHFIWSPPKIG